jgi:hypothetical protein
MFGHPVPCGPSYKSEGELMVKLTQEQTDLLILIGKPDDGSQVYVVVNGERITHELVRLGLVHYRGKDSTGKDNYDLTDEGERIYGELTGDMG